MPDDPPNSVPAGSRPIRTVRQAAGFEEPAARIYAAAFTAALDQDCCPAEASRIARAAVRDFAHLLDEAL